MQMLVQDIALHQLSAFHYYYITVHISSQINIAESKVLQTDSRLTYQEQNGDMITKCQPSLHGNISGKKQ